MVGIYIKVNDELNYKVREQMQLDYCKELVKEEQFEIYYDVGNTRVSRDKLLRSIEEGNITKIVTYNFSRLSRDTKEIIDILETLKNKKVKLITVQEGDNNKFNNEHMISVIKNLSELEKNIN